MLKRCIVLVTWALLRLLLLVIMLSWRRTRQVVFATLVLIRQAIVGLFDFDKGLVSVWRFRNYN